jgi:hypothetical protein
MWKLTDSKDRIPPSAGSKDSAVNPPLRGTPHQDSWRESFIRSEVSRTLCSSELATKFRTSPRNLYVTTFVLKSSLPAFVGVCLPAGLYYRRQQSWLGQRRETSYRWRGEVFGGCYPWDISRFLRIGHHSLVCGGTKQVHC